MKARIRLRMGSNHAHYAGGLVDGAKMLELFGDVATELCIRADGDEGLFRAYDAVEFLAPVRAGDFIEVEGSITRWGRTSLGMEFVARKVIVPTPVRDDTFDSSADLLPEPIIVARARGTCVVPDGVRRPEVRGRPAPCIVTAAIVGAETTRAQNPHLPLSADELAAEAEACAKAGASVIHLHVRDDEGRASQEGRRFRDAIRKIRARTDVIIQTSTGGAVGMSVAERAGPLECVGADAPEMATLNVGTINFGEDVFMNKAADTAEMARRIAAHGAVPEVEVYDAGHLDIAAELLKQGLVAAPLHLQFVLGVKGALSASEANLEFLIDRVATMLPASCTWGVAGVGRHQLPMAELAAMWGGNARVGLEDNIYVDKGVLAQGSAPLVARAVELCERHGRKVASVDEARAMLGVRKLA
ncbi:MAG TPA: 3-keto-5-aminohexanoate cleavage protein [Polyangia bacterium]|nr:3-keto-5-aminohexanoate cleavage protein [Polyangia bacterium]